KAKILAIVGPLPLLVRTCGRGSRRASPTASSVRSNVPNSFTGEVPALRPCSASRPSGGSLWGKSSCRRGQAAPHSNWICGSKQLRRPSLLVQRLAVPVVERFEARDQADSSEGDLVRARVVADVVRLATAEDQVRDPVRSGDDRVRDARARRARD